MHIRYEFILYNLVILIRCNVNNNSNGRRYSSVSHNLKCIEPKMVWRHRVYLAEVISNYNPKPSNYSEQSNRMINHIVYL